MKKRKGLSGLIRFVIILGVITLTADLIFLAQPLLNSLIVEDAFSSNKDVIDLRKEVVDKAVDNNLGKEAIKDKEVIIEESVDDKLVKADDSEMEGLDIVEGEIVEGDVVEEEITKDNGGNHDESIKEGAIKEDIIIGESNKGIFDGVKIAFSKGFGKIKEIFTRNKSDSKEPDYFVTAQSSKDKKDKLPKLDDYMEKKGDKYSTLSNNTEYKIDIDYIKNTVAKLCLLNQQGWSNQDIKELIDCDGVGDLAVCNVPELKALSIDLDKIVNPSFWNNQC